MEQLSMFGSQESEERSRFMTAEELYGFVSSCTAWPEDDTIVTEARIDRKSSPDAEDFSSACNLNSTKSGASLFFFGKKLCEICLSKSGNLQLTFDYKYLQEKPEWCDSFSVKERRMKENVYRTSVVETIYASESLKLFMQNAKLIIFRCLATAAIGCCNHYMECSDKRGCVKPHWLESIRCYYRGNLEQGKIFYGKNATI